jgi:hypothetical protein
MEATSNKSMADTQTCGVEATLEPLHNQVNKVTQFVLITVNVSRKPV